MVIIVSYNSVNINIGMFQLVLVVLLLMLGLAECTLQIFVLFPGEKFVVLDIPLLFESGRLVPWMKKIMVVYW